MQEQIYLLVANLVLLLVISFSTFRLNKKISHAYSPTPSDDISIPLSVRNAYKAINEALKSNQPYLELSVDDMPIQHFMGFYKGLKNHYGFDVELKSRQSTLLNKRYVEYLFFDFTKYYGVRSNLTPILIDDKPKHPPIIDDSGVLPFRKPIRNVRPNPFSNRHFEQPLWDNSYKPKQNLRLITNNPTLELLPTGSDSNASSENKVVSLDSYRKKKQIN